jgi:hypothetical protein
VADLVESKLRVVKGLGDFVERHVKAWVEMVSFCRRALCGWIEGGRCRRVAFGTSGQDALGDILSWAQLFNASSMLGRLAGTKCRRSDVHVECSEWEVSDKTLTSSDACESATLIREACDPNKGSLRNPNRPTNPNPP